MYSPQAVLSSLRRQVINPQARDHVLYLGASIAARALNVVYVLLVVGRANQAAFGQYAFGQVTALTAATVFSLNIISSLNVVGARLPSFSGSGAVLLSYVFSSVCTILAGLLLFAVPPQWVAQTSSVVTIWMLVVFFGSVTMNALSGFAYGAGHNISVALANFSTALVAVCLLLSNRGFSTDALMQIYGTSVIAGCLLVSGYLLVIDRARHIRVFVSGVLHQGPDLFRYGLMSIPNVAIVQVSLWLLQRAVIKGAGPVQTAHFALGTQFYNIMIFIPTLIAPLLLRSMAKATTDSAARAIANRWFIYGAMFGLFGCLVGFLGFYVLVRYMPKVYGQSYDAIILSIAAGAALLVKAPLSIYFQSKLAATPDLVANLIASAAMVGASLGISALDASAATIVRLTAHLFMIAVIWSFFLISRRKTCSI